MAPKLTQEQWDAWATQQIQGAGAGQTMPLDKYTDALTRFSDVANAPVFSGRVEAGMTDIAGSALGLAADTLVPGQRNLPSATQTIASAAADVAGAFAGEEKSDGDDYLIDYAIGPQSGVIKYANGVFADPSTGEVVYPNAAYGQPETVPGSPEWLRKIQDSWDNKKANAWRKRLNKLGFIPQGGLEPKGGIAQDLLSALKMFHDSRYLNYSKVLPMFPGGRNPLSKQIDKVALKEEIKEWGQIPFEEPLDGDTAEYFTNLLVSKLGDLQRKHGDWSPEQLMAGAELRTQQAFVKSPGVKEALQDIEDDEMDETMRNGIISIAQLASI